MYKEKGDKIMFKKFRQSSKILSLMLALIMVFGLTSTVFATNQGDGVLDIWATNGDIHAEMNAVEVGGVTRYTGYIEFPENSTQDLSQVQIKANITGTYDLVVDGTNYSENMVVDFSDGYVNFVLKQNGVEFRTYQINAGIEGTHTNILVTFNLDNAVSWLNGSYQSQSSDGYQPPLADKYPVAKTRVQNAVSGFGEVELINHRANVGDTAMKTFEDAISGKDYTVVGINQGYISEIGRGNKPTLPDRLFQREVGEPDFPEGDYMKDRTGWIYLMNDNVANMGATQYIITSNDKSITWGYTFDWGVDLGASW